jgi:epoxyqueuosine reductase
LDLRERTQWIKGQAYDIGFDFVGIAAARKLEQDAIQLEKWLKNQDHGKMSYMERHFDKRTDPRLLVPGARSVVSLLYNYHSKAKQAEKAPKIAKYAYGEDYHYVIKDKLYELMDRMEEKIGQIEGRVFVDSAPVMDRAWARESGLGWIGKNSMLINKQRGSDFFIAELIIDLDLEYDSPIGDYCGTCTKCIDACPTDAIMPERTIHSERCISYLTIELRDQEIDASFKEKMNEWVFGCDICQDVCPWNRFAKPHQEDRFLPKRTLLDLSREEWEDLDEPQFKELFKRSAVKRTKYSGLKRNIEFLKK